ncbi:hypothetical protein [Desulfosoma caldarium]|uniref:Uncharacterized protein n=1 Tax=Desulfosoma caldarium TaxID=610254 RepID=A0A3N1UHC4_9BACT|nr:hypothetical protein [Desulfosoma caldarium]ROQ90665.1 hypothetical protein EDC27_2547 [Desulfosoma caldarium]
MQTVVVHFTGETFHAVTVRTRGKAIVSWAEGPGKLSDLSGVRTVLLWEPPMMHFLREQVFRGPGDVLALQIQEKVERTGFFRTPPSIFYQVEREEGQVVHVGIVAMETSGLDEKMKSLWRHGARIHAVYHPALAVAFLAAQSFEERTLTVWIKERGFYLAVTEKAQIRAVRFVAFDAFTGPMENLVQEEVAFTRDQFERAGEPGPLRVQACGPLRHLLDSSEALWASSTMASSVQEAAIEHPEWFGAFYVPAAFNMLPDQVQAWNRHMPWARRAAVALLVVSLAQAGFWGVMKHRTQVLEKKTRGFAAEVASRADSVQKTIPWDRVAVLEEHRQVLEAFEREPRMDAWMVWLSKVVPKNFRVVRCTLSKTGGGSRSGPTVSRRPQRRPESHTETAPASVLSLVVKGTVGFEEAHRNFGVLLATLKERQKEVSGRFDYDERANQAVFSFELKM